MVVRAYARFIAEVDLRPLPLRLPPNRWIERLLRKGKCVVLLDGLDEIADPDARKVVAAWVEQQMAQYGPNRFIITSRPFGYRSNPLSGVTVLEIQPFTGDQVQKFVY